MCVRAVAAVWMICLHWRRFNHTDEKFMLIVVGIIFSIRIVVIPFCGGVILLCVVSTTMGVEPFALRGDSVVTIGDIFIAGY